MSITHTSSVGTIYLKPRPYIRESGVLVLVRLVAGPQKQPASLPPETWFRILSFVFDTSPSSIDDNERKLRAGLLRVSKTFKIIASPLIYSDTHFTSSNPFKQFSGIIKESDKKWDSLRRIPYSTPGRWVQALDLSRLMCSSPRERLAFDSALTQLFPLIPFLSRLCLNSSIKLSRYAMDSLALREGVQNLRILKGLKWEDPPPYFMVRSDPLINLLGFTQRLEELEIIGPGWQDDDEDPAPVQLITPPSTPLPPLSLPNLHTLKLILLAKGPILEELLRSSLPSLNYLTITPYDDLPSNLTSSLLAMHGPKLSKLVFHTPKTWPPTRHATPRDIFQVTPGLLALSLTLPLPSLLSPPSEHPLRIIAIPRPNPVFLCLLERWLHRGLLPHLKEVHLREISWIRSGLSQIAAETGVQGEMMDWKRRLLRWKIRVVDGNGRD